MIKPITFGSRYTYLVKGKPEALTDIKDTVSLHGPGAIKNNQFVLTVTDSKMYVKDVVKKHLAEFKELCAQREVQWTRVRAPFKSLLKRLINK